MRIKFSLTTGIMTTILTLAIGIGVTTTSVSAESNIGFLGDNPSGKVGRDGLSPLSHKPTSLKSSLKNTSDSSSANTFKAECPPTVKCIVMPAAYSANNGDVGDYGNYDHTNRPKDGMKIDSVVIHDTEGDLQSVLDAFKDPTFYASSHYVINTDGTIYQMVQTKDIAWHAGNWSTNMHSIGIEHVGFSAKSESYTPQMYYASQQLIKYLTDKFNIPRDRTHVIGHDNVAVPFPARIPTMHVDPGPFWNWQNYMAGTNSPVLPSFNLANNIVTVAPTWPLNKQPVTGCADEANTSCVPTGLQPTNFVYLRTEPRNDAPLITDVGLGQGTTDIKNNAARLFHGQKFAVADKKIEVQGTWYQVWTNGTKGWFLSPWNAPTAFTGNAKYITPKAGVESIPVYGRPVPELSEYPADLIAVPPASFFIPSPTPLPYTITSGQKYTVISTDVPTQNFYAWASDSSFPYDHTLFKGQTKYIQIQLGNRVGFVKAADVIVH